MPFKMVQIILFAGVGRASYRQKNRNSHSRSIDRAGTTVVRFHNMFLITLAWDRAVQHDCNQLRVKRALVHGSPEARDIGPS